MATGFYGRPRVAAPGEQAYESLSVSPVNELPPTIPPPRIIPRNTQQSVNPNYGGPPINPQFGPLKFDVNLNKVPRAEEGPYDNFGGGLRTKRRRHRTRRTAKKKTSTTKRRKLNRKTKKRK